MTLPDSTGVYRPWETIEVIPNSDDGFTCSRCNRPFVLIALFEYADSQEGLKRAIPYWCDRCDAPPKGVK